MMTKHTQNVLQNSVNKILQQLNAQLRFKNAKLTNKIAIGIYAIKTYSTKNLFTVIPNGAHQR